MSKEITFLIANGQSLVPLCSECERPIYGPYRKVCSDKCKYEREERLSRLRYRFKDRFCSECGSPIARSVMRTCAEEDCISSARINAYKRRAVKVWESSLEQMRKRNLYKLKKAILG